MFFELELKLETNYSFFPKPFKVIAIRSSSFTKVPINPRTFTRFFTFVEQSLMFIFFLKTIMQFLFKLHFVGLSINVVHLHQYIPSFLRWFCIFNMHNDLIGHIHKKPIQDFPSFLMRSFVGLNLLLCGDFWERRFFLTTSYERLITFPHQKNHNPKFPHLEIIFI